MRSCLERIQERDGTVNREGAKFYSVTLDTIGWFGRSVADLGLLADLYARGQVIFCRLWHPGRLGHSCFIGAAPLAPLVDNLQPDNPKDRDMNFGILVFPGVEELDFIGPWEMLTMWSEHLKGPMHCRIVAQSYEPVTCAKRVSINPHVSFADCPPLDYLLVPGGMGTRTEVDNPVIIDFIAAQARHCKEVLSVCTGAFMLHRAGLLMGKKATTHWASLNRLRAFGDVQVVEERLVRDAGIWCSAGVSAGIDMTLAFIAAVAGDEVAGQVQLAAEFYPDAKRYGGAAVLDNAPRYIRETR